MNILFINASPRQNGFTAQTLREIRQHISSVHTCQWVDTNDLQIKPCQGCLRCRPNKACVLPEDDGHRVAELIKTADALVLGSPTYFGNITGPLRTLIDRSLTAIEEIAVNGLEAPIPLHKGKRAAIVTACNMPYPGSELPNQGAGTLFAMEIVTKAGGYDLVGKMMVNGAASRKGLSAQLKTEACQLADKLMNNDQEKRNP